MYITSDCGKTWRQVHHVLNSLLLLSDPSLHFPSALMKDRKSVNLSFTPNWTPKFGLYSFYNSLLFVVWKFHLFIFQGFRRGASHPVSGPRGGHCCHQGHLYSPQDTQVRLLLCSHSNMTTCYSVSSTSDMIDMMQVINIIYSELVESVNQSIKLYWYCMFHTGRAVQSTLYVTDKLTRAIR